MPVDAPSALLLAVKDFDVVKVPIVVVPVKSTVPSFEKVVDLRLPPVNVTVEESVVLFKISTSFVPVIVTSPVLFITAVTLREPSDMKVLDVVNVPIVLVPDKLTTPAFVKVVDVKLPFVNVTVESDVVLYNVVIVLSPLNNTLPLLVNKVILFSLPVVVIPVNVFVFVKLDNICVSVIFISSALDTLLGNSSVPAFITTLLRFTVPASFLIAIALSSITTLFRVALAAVLYT